MLSVTSVETDATVGPPFPYAIFNEPPFLPPVAISASTETTSRKSTLEITATAFVVTSVKVPFESVIPDTFSAFDKSTLRFVPSFKIRLMLFILNKGSSSDTTPR